MAFNQGDNESGGNLSAAQKLWKLQKDRMHTESFARARTVNSNGVELLKRNNVSGGGIISKTKK